jgi:hypothetical protein
MLFITDTCPVKNVGNVDNEILAGRASQNFPAQIFFPFLFSDCLNLFFISRFKQTLSAPYRVSLGVSTLRHDTAGRRSPGANSLAKKIGPRYAAF